MGAKQVLAILILLVFIGGVLAEPPKVQLVVTPFQGDAPLEIVASEGTGDPAIYDWQYTFGDGTDPVVHGKEVRHTFERAGEYRVELRVVNEKGEESVDSTTVVVSEPQKPEPVQVIIWEGLTPITDSLAAKSPTASKEQILSTATSAALKDVKYPYLIDKTEITIQKYKCTADICGYWITATRNGREVYTNSPIWISPPPYEVVVSDVYDEKTNTQTVTIKEDPKLAVEQLLQRYVDNQPLGKAVSYER